MKTSESITNIAKALVAFGKAMPKVPKDKTNPHFKNKYATLSIMIEKATPHLTANGLVIVQQIDGDSLTTTLIHESGEYMTATASMPCAAPSNPQAMGSAITYARRYAYGSILSLDIDDDDDANAATQSAPPKKNSAPPATHSAPPVKADLTPSHPKWNGAVTALAKDETTIEAIRKAYNVSDVNATKLAELAAEFEP
jgi:hypothetical protein